MTNDNETNDNNEADNDTSITATHTTISKGYYDLSPDEKRAFLRSLLGGMSPNPEVRADATENIKKFRKPADD